MFTGIVKGLCPIVDIVDSEGMRRLKVAFEDQVTGEGLEIGASVAINGTCLTVTSFHQEEKGTSGTVVTFDCIQETLRRTNLGGLKVGDRVNVERAMKYGDEVGGHHVSGHVDTVGTIKEIVQSPNNQDVFVRFPEAKVLIVAEKPKLFLRLFLNLFIFHFVFFCCKIAERCKIQFFL